MASRWIARHGAMHFLGEFDADEGLNLARGDQVILRTDRGQEVGFILCEASQRTAEFLGEAPAGQVIRLLKPEDEAEIEALHEREQRALDSCCRIVKQRQLQMELVDVEHLFGGE